MATIYEVYEGRHEWRESLFFLTDQREAEEAAARLNAAIGGFYDGECRVRAVPLHTTSAEAVRDFAEQHRERIKPERSRYLSCDHAEVIEEIQRLTRDNVA